MTELEKYTNAVAQRKSVERKTAGGVKVNVAVLLELEEADVPRLLEIIRLQDETLQEIVHEVEGESESHILAVQATIKVEELAACGSKAKFGDYDGTNGSRSPST